MAESAEVLALPAEGGGAPLGPKPGEVWSLWDMLRAYAHEFAVVDRHITQILLDYTPTQPAADAFQAHYGHTWPDYSAGLLAAMEAQFMKLPIGPAVRKQFARTVKELHRGSYADGCAAVQHLRTTLRDEMEDLNFVLVTPALSAGLGDAPAFGEAVEQAFPSSGLEIKDAARCLAFGQGTAAVFHCMRALEPVLVALGAEFKVSVRENWNDALNAIQNAIRARTNKNDRPNWKEDEPFYMEACTHFFIIKNAWRNHTMHLRLRFSEQDALSVYEHTRTFMQHLATRLSEDVEGASPGEDAP